MIKVDPHVKGIFIFKLCSFLSKSVCFPMQNASFCLLELYVTSQFDSTALCMRARDCSKTAGLHYVYLASRDELIYFHRLFVILSSRFIQRAFPQGGGRGKISS